MRRLFCLLLLLAAPASLARPPRLTLVVVVDALGSDVLLRHRPFLKRGLGTLLQGGAFFPYARYAFAEPSTAAGHATLVTGANPWRHGVVGNRLLDRGGGRAESIFADATHPVLEAPLAPHDDVSPLRLEAETLADRLRMATGGRGKVVAVGGKARAAIPLAGRLGQAYWFHEGVGRFVTGTWYGKELPAWARTFNEGRPADAWAEREWTLSLPAREYLAEDDRPFEEDAHRMGRTFPHPLSGGGRGAGPASYAALAASPLSGELLVDFARAALQGEALGRDEVPDVLAVSFSGVDYVYHHYGPYSVEMQDALVKLDAQLSELLQAAEKAAGGRGNLLVALAGDHGGAAMPEEWARSGMPGARVAPSTLQQGLLRELQGRFGADLLVGLDETDVYLGARTKEAAARVDSAEVRRAAARWLAQQPQVRLAVARDDLFHAADPGGFLPALQKGYFRGRSGDVLLVLQPFHVATGTQHGTNHGMPYSYDTQVPFVLYGAGVKKGHYRQEMDATDVAPTLSALLELGMPALSEGRVRSEALNGNGK